MTQQPWGTPQPPSAAWPPPQPGWPAPQAPQWSAQQQWPAQRQWPPQQQWGAPQQWPSAPQAWPPQQQWPAPQQQWPAPQQQWPAPQPAGRPPRRPSLLGIVLRLALLVVALVFVSSVVRSILQPSTPPVDPGPATVPGNGSYVNEGYSPPPPNLNPPPIPGPRDAAAADTLIRQNQLYTQTVPTPTRCGAGGIDGTTASKAELEGYLTTMMGCLMTVWNGPVTDAGFQLPRPPVTVYDRPVKTACGNFDDVNAAYCSGDQRIYYAQPLLRSFPASIRNSPHAVSMIVAHEFGHAIQARTAILASEKRLEDRAASENAALELSRRIETQADCLAGQYVRSIAQSQGMSDADLRSLGTFTYNLGDDVLSGKPGWSEGHGLGTTRQNWFVRGLGSSAVSTCNTFTVPGSQVR